MTNLVGHKNRYTCQKCNSYYITVDKDDGTTPFMAPCQVRFCDGMAQSEFYRVDQSLPATHEWYRASNSEARGMKPHMRQHHDLGGLFLRKASITMTLRDDVEVKSDLDDLSIYRDADGPHATMTYDNLIALVKRAIQ